MVGIVRGIIRDPGRGALLNVAVPTGMDGSGPATVVEVRVIEERHDTNDAVRIEPGDRVEFCDSSPWMIWSPGGDEDMGVLLPIFGTLLS